MVTLFLEDDDTSLSPRDHGPRTVFSQLCCVRRQDILPLI